MIRQKEILKKYLLYFLIGIVICLVGVSGVFAETITDMTFSQFRTTISTYGITSNQYIYDTTSAVPVQMDASANGFSWEWITNYTSNCSGQTVISGQLAIPNDNLTYDWLDDNIKTIYYVPFVGYTGGSTPCTWSVNASNNIVSFTCSTAEPHNNFIIGGTLQYRPNSNFNTYFRIYRTFNITCDNSASAIIDNQSQNTQNIINNNNNNTQDIINNNNQNTQDIINSNKVCTSIDKTNIAYDNRVLNSSGALQSTNVYGVTDYIDINQADVSIETIFDSNNWAYICYYNVNKSLISCENLSNISTLTIPNNSYYFRSSILKASNKPTFKVCKNGSQATNDALNNLDDTLKDDSVDDNNIASSFEDFNDFLDDNSTITQLITLPITLYTAILNNLNGTCSPFNLGALYGENLVLPCINVSQYLGNTLWNMIDIIISGFAIFAISKKMIKVFNNFSSLREGDVIDD